MLVGQIFTIPQVPISNPRKRDAPGEEATFFAQKKRNTKLLEMNTIQWTRSPS